MIATPHQGHVPGSARRAVGVACVRDRATRVPNFWHLVYVGGNGTPALMGFTSIKRPARHLGSRST
jgi:hypothetical protein